MSLFGTSPPGHDAGPTTPKRSHTRGASSLFDDEPSPVGHRKTGSSGGSGLFADEGPAGDDSPWDMPTPRKQQSRAELIRKLLPSADAPESYIEVFETVVREDGNDGRVSSGGIAKVFAMARLDADAQASIMAIVAPGNSTDATLGRNEFNVLLALIGLAQEGDVISLDGVDERRRNLPQPKLSGITTEATLPPITELAAKAPQTPSKPVQSPPQASRTELPKTPVLATRAMDDPEDDPWNTPDMHKGHNHSISNGVKPSKPVDSYNGFTAASPPKPNHTLTDAYKPALPPAPAEEPRVEPQQASTTTRDQGAWGYFGNNTPAPSGFADVPAATGNPFGSDGPGPSPRINPQPNPPTRVVSGRTGSSIEENIIVTLMPGKEGVFMFQHHNYEITSMRRACKVIRRYSDFVWLLDCLQKRYPFRVLPLLPPKRVAVNGNHLSNDGSFIEKRRRGLARFLGALVRHPVLSQEQLVVMFLTVPTELAVWRKQSTISVQDEFTDKHMPPGLEDSLAPTLEDLFTRTRAGVRRSAELYINICNIMDRLVKRTEGVAADHARIAMSLISLTESSTDTYATDTNEIPLLNDGLVAMSKHLSTCQTLLEDESRGWEQGVLEDLKRQRDSLVSLREMFDRRERLDRDTIPQLEKRIQASETKLTALRNKPEGTVKPGEIEKVAESIIKDKESIVQQHNRSIFVKECVRDELITFQTTQYHISRWNQDWAGERVKYAEMLADNWRRLMDELEGMPLGD